jgi:transposase-like protein
VSHDDVLFGYRLQRFDLAGRTSVSRACRTFGVHRSTYYAWKAQVDRQGLEVLPTGAAAPEDAKPAVGACRGADRRLLARPSGAARSA